MHSSSFLSLLASLALAGFFSTSTTLFASAQFIRPPTDLISKAGAASVGVRYKKVLTGICETRPNVTTLSGYIDVAKNEHTYFHFVEARKGDPKKAPLTVWIQGGPGGSAQIALFQSVGSCRIDKDMKVSDNPAAWNEASNMLFLDQPATVGFSYIDEPAPGYIDMSTLSIIFLPNATCPSYAAALGTCGMYGGTKQSSVPKTTAEAAPSFYMALQGFIGAFPEYAQSGVNIASESYGGLFVPAYSRYILDKNKEALPDHKAIDLKAITIGNGLYDPALQYGGWRDFMAHNAYGIAFPEPAMLEAQSNAWEGPGNCRDQLEECYKTNDNRVCYSAIAFCADNVGGAMDANLGRDPFDIRRMANDTTPFPAKFYERYLADEKVMSALGVPINYTYGSPGVFNGFTWSADITREGRHSIENIRFLLEQGITVGLFVGDADYRCNINGHAAVAKQIGAKGFEEAGWTNVSTSDGIVHAQVKQAGLFSLTQVYLAGHAAAAYQPLVALAIFERAINSMDIATGTQVVSANSSYKTVGPAVRGVYHGPAAAKAAVSEASKKKNKKMDDDKKPKTNTLQRWLDKLTHAPNADTKTPTRRSRD